MSYITERHYLKVYGGKVESGLGELISRAAALVDALTHNRIRAAGFDSLTAFQKKAVKRAMCLMVDYMGAGGERPGADVASYWLNDMRINLRNRKLRPWEAAGCGMWAWIELMQTGLMRIAN